MLTLATRQRAAQLLNDWDVGHGAFTTASLVQNGVQRGEVVMIFAHRGVDLVVAIMAVLAAGATFSVLDPL